MNKERWQRINQIYHAALEATGADRNRVLSEACADDADLRTEVESLLATHEHTDGFLGKPAIEEVARQFNDEPASLLGAKIGSYQITSLLGSGGMGVVYKALDTRLNRSVAIKALPGIFTADPERRARLEREARVLATLSHPNIAAIYGLEESDGKPYLVLELVEGQTLAHRLKNGRIPLDETLDICRQIAEGLESAHDKGFVHRDLKPGNLMITSDDKVKILDFGLAKALFGQVAPGEPSESPTIADQTTSPGVILGTAAYMSPEQARGKPADRRADSWAFGCILFECLAGKAAFGGDTITECLAAVIRADPDLTALPPDTPVQVREVIRRCLQKDLALRMRDVGDARIELGERLAETPQATPWRLPVSWLAAGAMILLLTGALAGRFLLRRPQAAPQPAVVRSIIKLEPGHILAGMIWESYYRLPTRTAVVMSKDGSFIVYSAIAEDAGPQVKPQLYIRRTDQLEARAIPGTQGGISPFLSPDDRWVGFWADARLLKAPIDGGVPVTLCDSQMPFGASWGPDNTIVFAPDSKGGLLRVSAGGGDPELLTKPDKANDEYSHRLPHWLPHGKGVLFTILRDPVDLLPRVALLDISTREWHILTGDAADACYVPTGHLVFLRQGTLMVLPFDLETNAVRNRPVPAIAGIAQSINYAHVPYNTCAGQFSVSDTGRLVYASGGCVPDMENSLVWVDQEGNAQPATQLKLPFCAPRLSPDGQLVAYYTIGREWRLWIYDFNRGTRTQLTNEGKAVWPNWTPDGKRLVFGWWRAGRPNLFWQAADGSSPMERLTASESANNPGTLSPDGTTVAFIEERTETGWDILLLDLRSRRVTPFVQSRSNETYPCFSPDGRWIAYVSDETGRGEVYVQAFSGRSGKVQVSSGGGREPLWARDGRRLFYLWGDQVWAVDVRTDAGLAAGRPRLLFEKPGYANHNYIRGWDISTDSRRFLTVRREDKPPQPVTELILVQNWFEELKRLFPSGR